MGYRYIGAKTKSLGKVLEKISTLVPVGGHVCDLMSGTGAVSAALRENDYRVTAVDLMTFSYHHARVALLFTEAPKFRNAEEFIDLCSSAEQSLLFPPTPYESIIYALNSVRPMKGYFWREFSSEGTPQNSRNPRNYYSPANAEKIDAIRASIIKLSRNRQINELEHSLLLHDLIMAANDVANIAGTYGHYLSRITGRAKEPVVLKTSPLLILKDDLQHAVLKGYAEEIAANISCDLCYIDPPYMKRQYAANYHVLETIAREDEPEAIGVSGLRPWRDQYSNFCTKTRVRDSFGQIFENTKCRDFLISYSEDGLLSLDELADCFAKYGVIQVSAFRYKRFRSNDSRLAPQLAEYLIHLRTRK